jgi:FMN phosphatase YigB (HAD superfamily)
MNEAKPEISLLILDLDNTLYDWVGFFVPAFYEMVDVAGPIAGVPTDVLLSDLQEVHQRYGNSEHPYALLETKAVLSKFPGKTRAELADIFDSAFHAFNKKRLEHLRLFPGVRETLDLIKETGCIIVAYTEAIVTNGVFRLETLGVLRHIHRLYAPTPKGLGHPRGKEFRRIDLPNDFLHMLPADHRKPDPHVIGDVVEDYRADPACTLYVGDSITRDMSMAIRAGVHSAWARYGTMFDKGLWDKLVRVTHWTERDVQREALLRADAKDVAPDVELQSFAELPHYFRFREPNSASKSANTHG